MTTKHGQFPAHTGNIEGDVFFLVSRTALQGKGLEHPLTLKMVTN